MARIDTAVSTDLLVNGPGECCVGSARARGEGGRDRWQRSCSGCVDDWSFTSAPSSARTESTEGVLDIDERVFLCDETVAVMWERLCETVGQA